jgi:hypothetical protein
MFSMRNEAALEPCVPCKSPDCGATLVLSGLPSQKKHFNQEENRLELTCPACNRFFHISLLKLEWLEVDDSEFAQGFFGPSYAFRIWRWIQSSQRALLHKESRAASRPEVDPDRIRL